MPGDREVIANLATEWDSINALLTGLDDKDWDRPTDCPGWTVKDQVAHLIGTESWLLGRAQPARLTTPLPPHVKNPLAERNEAWVAERRPRPPGEVLDEFREVTGARLAALRAMTADEMAATIEGPLGPTSYEEFMRVRLMDNWVHEQDIRRAVGHPGHLDGSVAAASLARFTSALPFVVGKRAAAPDATTVVLHLTGPVEQTLAATMRERRAHPATPSGADWTVRLTMNAEVYARLSCGRLTITEAVANDDVSIEGDRELGERVLAGMSIIF